MRFHLDDQAEGRDDMRRKIDAWWPHVERGVEAFAMTASGCGAMVNEYGHHLRHDPRVRRQGAAHQRADARHRRGPARPRRAALERLAPQGRLPKVAFHPPCSLQHWQKLGGVAEELLARLGYELTPVPDAHLCCGSAGTYSLLQPELSARLKQNKLAALQSGLPELILTANIGCQTHLAAGAAVPVRHWIVDLDERLARA